MPRADLPNDRPAAPPGDGPETADVLRVLRLLLTAVELSGPDGLILAENSPLVCLARRLVGDSGPNRHTTRTALMALRDLTWRVDSARSLLEPHLDPEGRTVLASLLTTDDIHVFLNQEP